MISLAISAFFATIGFAVMFQIKGKKVIYAALGGSVGAIVYHLTLNILGYSAFVSLLYTSMAMSLYSEICARLLKCPVTLFLICALICFVPGGTMYYAIMALISGDGTEAVSLITYVMSAASALAIGIVLVSTAVKLYYNLKKKIKEKK